MSKQKQDPTPPSHSTTLRPAVWAELERFFPGIHERAKAMLEAQAARTPPSLEPFIGPEGSDSPIWRKPKP